jgi:hypothetical protein
LILGGGSRNEECGHGKQTDRDVLFNHSQTINS